MHGRRRHRRGHACRIASAQGAWYPRLRAAESIHLQCVTVPRTHCGPRSAYRYGSARGTPVVSRAVVETARIACSRSAALAGCTQTGATRQPSGPREQTRALVACGPQCSAVLGGRGRQSKLRYASWAARGQLGTGVHSVGVCGHALRARDASWVSFGRLHTAALSKAGAQVAVGSQGAPPTCCDHAQLLEAGGINAVGGLASGTARSRSSPQRSGSAMPAAVQPVAAGDRPTAALPLSAGP